DAEIDRRTTARRLAAVLGLVRDDPQQPGPKGRAGPEPVESEIRLREALLGGVLGIRRGARDHVRGPGRERLIAPHQLAVCVLVSTLRTLHEIGVLRRSALHGVGSHPPYNHPAKRFPHHAVTSRSSSRTRRSIAAGSARSIPSTLTSSTA